MHNETSAAAADRFLRLPEVIQRTGLSRATYFNRKRNLVVRHYSIAG